MNRKECKMQFTTTVKNILTNKEYTFTEWFGVEECFDRSKATFDLIVKKLKLEDPDSYDSVEELIEYYDVDLEPYIKIQKIKGFDFKIDTNKTTYSEICVFYELEELEIEKIAAYAEYQGNISVTDILYLDWDDINLYKDINTDKELGHYYVDSLLGDISALSKEELEKYFDYKKYGHDIAVNNGSFTSKGFLEIH